VSELNGHLGDGDSGKPVIGNSGYTIAFETQAGNLGIGASGRLGDDNGVPDVYLYTDNRRVTLLESVKDGAKPLPGGGTNPGMNFYNNYITFDSPAPIGAASGPSQVYMRYLGPADANHPPQEDNLDAPTQGSSAGVIPSGFVTIRLPAGASPKYRKALGVRGAAAGFVRLTQAADVPVGSILDTSRGKVQLFTSAGLGRPLNVGDLNGGQFQVTQRKKNPLTTLSMTGGGLSKCGTRVPRGGARKPAVTEARRRRRLFASVHGHFRNRGRNSSATVRGTQWAMTDTCAGTLTTVRQGIVSVRDFVLHKTIRVRKGQRYFARAPKRH
jgi:hypothetical protein